MLQEANGAAFAIGFDATYGADNVAVIVDIECYAARSLHVQALRRAANLPDQGLCEVAVFRQDRAAHHDAVCIHRCQRRLPHIASTRCEHAVAVPHLQAATGAYARGLPQIIQHAPAYLCDPVLRGHLRGTKRRQQRRSDYQHLRKLVHVFLPEVSGRNMLHAH